MAEPSDPRIFDLQPRWQQIRDGDILKIVHAGIQGDPDHQEVILLYGLECRWVSVPIKKLTSREFFAIPENSAYYFD
jgi:hypothetical protein